MFNGLRTRLDRRWALASLRKQRAELDGEINVEGDLLYVQNAGRLKIGRNVSLRAITGHTRIRVASGASLFIGAGSLVNDGCRIFACEHIEIGEGCLIGDGCWIFDSNLHAADEGNPVRVRPIKLSRNVWLGRLVQIMPGVTIGEHSVISAGSVVYGAVPAREVWRGNPAVKVRDLAASDAFQRQ